MNVSKATVIYFTGTNTTERYAEAFARAFPRESELCSLRFDAPLKKTFDADELLVLAGPVYGGYLPSFIWEQLENIEGSMTPAVLLAVYGARDYDNALLEMDAKLSAKGFKTIGAAALVARHSIATNIATGRPDEEDLHGLERFAQTIYDHLNELSTLQEAPVFHFKGSLDGHPAKFPAPETNEDCTKCGICAMECPVGAIPDEKPNTTDGDTCISCMRCIEVCPFDARHESKTILERVQGFLADKADPSKRNEYF